MVTKYGRNTDKDEKANDLGFRLESGNRRSNDGYAQSDDCGSKSETECAESD